MASGEDFTKEMEERGISDITKVAGIKENYCTGLGENYLWCISAETKEKTRCGYCNGKLELTMNHMSQLNVNYFRLRGEEELGAAIYSKRSATPYHWSRIFEFFNLIVEQV